MGIEFLQRIYGDLQDGLLGFHPPILRPNHDAMSQVTAFPLKAFTGVRASHR
jgi:hypothetical protein